MPTSSHPAGCRARRVATIAPMAAPVTVAKTAGNTSGVSWTSSGRPARRSSSSDQGTASRVASTTASRPQATATGHRAGPAPAVCAKLPSSHGSSVTASLTALRPGSVTAPGLAHMPAG
jgi:hypothetical protein